MAIILPQLQRQPGALEQLQTGLGSGLSSGLQNLAQMKMDEILGQKEYQKFLSFMGKGSSETPTGQTAPTIEAGKAPEQVTAGYPSSGYIKPGKALEYAKFFTEKEYRDKKIKSLEKKEEFERHKYFNENYLKPSRERAEKAQEVINDYNKIIKIAKSGQLRSPTTQKLLEKFNLGELWSTPGQQLGGSLVTGLATGAGAAFNTNRLTNLEVGTYKAKHAKLTNTPEAIELIGKNSILENEAYIEKNKAEQKVFKRNPNLTPAEFEIAVDEEVQPKLKKLAEQANKNLDEALTSQERQEGFKLGPELSQLPPANTVPGKEYFVDGKRVISDGQRWVEKETGAILI